MSRSARRNAARTLREIAAAESIDYGDMLPESALALGDPHRLLHPRDHPFLKANRRWLQCAQPLVAVTLYRRA
ncbi:MAG: hypothetical protein IPO35_05210 [Uliginosibacterium sp.]|nr:hypothetical protein [Uliginosibacterium sp.]